VYNTLEKTFHRWVLWLTDKNKFLFSVQVNLFIYFIYLFEFYTVMFTCISYLDKLGRRKWRREMEAFLYVQRMKLIIEYAALVCVCVCLCLCVCARARASIFYALIHVIDADVQICISNNLDVLTHDILGMVS
jgi:hypothetical protein